MRRAILVLLCTVFYLHAFSQDISIEGAVVDSALHNVEAATVSLCEQDGSVLSVAITDDKGKFKLSGHYKKNNALLQITHISYLPQSFIVKRDTVVTIRLKKNSYMTDELVVSGKRKVIEFKGGDIIVNVSQVPNSATSNVAKVLSKLPGVTASAKEGLTLNGATATLYIDGRKQSLPSSSIINMIESLPAASVEQVELKAYADGTQDASDSGAIINLKTKKQRLDGYFLTVGAESVLGAKKSNLYGGSNVFYMFKKKNVIFNTSLSYKHDYSWNTNRDSTRFRDGSDLNRDAENISRTNIYMGSANLAWDIKDGHTLNINAFVYDDFSTGDGRQDIAVTNSLADRDYILKTKRSGNDDLWSGNIEYSSPDSLDSKLVASYGVIYGGLRSEKDYYSQLNDDDNKKWFLNSKPEMVGYRHTGKIDFTHKFKEIGLKLSTGIKGDFGNLDDDVVFVNPSSIGENQNSHTTANYSDSHFNGKENVYAAYAAARFYITKSFGVSATARVEHTEYDMNLKSSNTKLNNDYTNYFQYLHLYLNYFKNYQVKMGYVSNIQRANYEHMLPGVRYNNEFSYTVGNANLQPTLSRGVFMANYIFKYAYILLRYDYITDVEGQVLTGELNNVTKYEYTNYADMHRLYASIYLPFQFFNKKLSGNLSSVISKKSLTNAKNGFVIPDGRNDYWKWNCKAIANYEIINNLNVNTWMCYNPAYSTAQYDYKSNWCMDLGLSYSLLENEKLTLAFDAENIFNTYNNEYTYYYDGNTMNSYSRSSNRFFKFSVFFKLNGGEKIRDKARNSVNDVSRFNKE